MEATEELKVESDWYEIVEGDTLKQGDILVGCPCFYPPDISETTNLEELNEDLEFEIGNADLVILTQSCDMNRETKGQIDQRLPITLCTVHSLSNMESKGILSSRDKKEKCRKGGMPSFCMLEAINHEELRMGLSVVDFRNVVSLPFGFIENIAVRSGPRLRMKPPYREYLSQAYALYIMRVGLPADIERF